MIIAFTYAPPMIIAFSYAPPMIIAFSYAPPMIIAFTYAPPMITPVSHQMRRPPLSKAASRRGAVTLMRRSRWLECPMRRGRRALGRICTVRRIEPGRGRANAKIPVAGVPGEAGAAGAGEDLYGQRGRPGCEAGYSGRPLGGFGRVLGARGFGGSLGTAGWCPMFHRACLGWAGRGWAGQRVAVLRARVNNPESTGRRVCEAGYTGRRATRFCRAAVGFAVMVGRQPRDRVAGDPP